MKNGRLSVVGTGIQYYRDMTLGSIAEIRAADKVFYLITDSLTEEYVKEINPNTIDLSGFYEVGKPRSRTYDQIVSTVATSVRAGSRVCLVAYGHPGVFASPPHRLIHLLRSEGYQATMLPSVSAEDCLFADIGLDPGAQGCQSYEASDFMARKIVPCTNVPLVLWQVGVIGVADHPSDDDVRAEGIVKLRHCLLQFYPADHNVTLYQASIFSLAAPIMVKLSITALDNKNIRVLSTMLVPQMGA
jgi:uncharacterized protein YabN with tetrapyrrole methylase and pyrophosphatase domain